MKNIYHLFKNFIKSNPEENNLRETNDENITKLMYMIDRPEPTKFFLDVRQMAGFLLQKQIDKLEGSHWLKTDLTYPSFEHLSIAYKNQIFCILVEIINKNTNRSYLPEQYKNNLIENCSRNNLVPCLYKMYVDNPLNPAYNTLKPIKEGWNLYSAITNLPLSIEEIADEKLIEMSNWELNNFAIQIVRDYINQQTEFKITSYQSVEGIDPQIWIEDSEGNHLWVVVRHTKFPENRALIPENINSIKLSCNGYNGFFASVAFHAQEGSEPDKLYRGKGAYINLQGLEPIT